MKLTKITTLLIIFSTITAVGAYSQTSIQDKYDALIERSSTWEQYKVITIPKTVKFKKSLDSTMQVRDSKILELEAEIKALNTQIDTLEASLSSVQSKLDASEELNDSISFLGIDMAKTAYHITVWTIILILALLAIVGYYMYMRSNNVTTKTRNEFEHLKQEFESHKDKARETQVRLKRELQTAVNTIDEMKRGSRR